VRDTPWDPLACKGRWRVWNSRCGNHLGQRFTNRINRPDIWMQAIRSHPEKTLVARGPSTYGSRRLTRNCALGRDDGWIYLRLLATRCARVLQIHSPLKTKGAVRSQEGRREDRVRAAPAVSCANAYTEKAHMSIQVQRKQSGLPCAKATSGIDSSSPNPNLTHLNSSRIGCSLWLWC
jgi:hypothetical protein